MTPSDESFSRAWWREQFRRQANHPLVWELAAVQLEYAAEVLLARQRSDFTKYFQKRTAPPFLMSTIMMLYGLAIEGLSKAILVTRSSPLNAKGRIALKSHDLLLLARKAGLKVSSKDEYMLRKLTTFVTWAGKYPVPLSHEGMQPFRWPDSSFGPLHGSMGGNDFKAARTLTSRLARLLPGRRLRAELPRFLRQPSVRRRRAAADERKGLRAAPNKRLKLTARVD